MIPVTFLYALAQAVVVTPVGFGPDALPAAMAQAQPGDTVQLAAGTYQLAAALTMKSGVTVLGAGQDQTTLVYRGDGRSNLVSINGCDDAELAHLTLDGQMSPLLNSGIGGGNSRRVKLHHLTIRDLVQTETFGPFGIIFNGVNPTCERGLTDSEISDCRIENIGVGAKYGGGIRLAWGCNDNRVLRNRVHLTGRGGIFGDHSTGLIVRENTVTGSGGTGLGLELWGGCHRSIVEDNRVDHWLSIDGGSQTAVRRNAIGTDDGTLKGYGIEIIARDVVVTDNVVEGGQFIGLSVSNKPVKNNVFWGYNTVRNCLQWGAQLQGEVGGAARHYFYRCAFENMVAGDERARYPKDSGHGFRTNGHCRQMVFEDCRFANNGGFGLQLGGPEVDALTFRDCTIQGNKGAAFSGGATNLRLENNTIEGNGKDNAPESQPSATPAPKADVTMPERIVAGQPAKFKVTTAAAAEVLWDFNDGIPEVAAEVEHVYEKAGEYRVTLVVWDEGGQGARVERMVVVE